MSLSVELHNHFPNFQLDVSFSLSGGVLGLLGPSGCGKSMTLRCLSGVEQPGRGKVVLNDRVLFDWEKRINLPPQQRRVGHLFQNYALFPHMTVEQNLLCGIGRKAPDRERRLRELLEQFQLTSVAAQRASLLSGGQQQRCALARCLGAEPELLLLDEPFSALDAHLKTALQLQLKEHLNHFPGPAILVTHDRDEAFLLCDRIAVMDKGKLLTIGEKGEVFRHPGSPAAARLTGCKNVVQAEKQGDGQVYVPDWGCLLTTAERVPEHLSAVGIRAHDFQPVSAPSENVVALTGGTLTEFPFEWNAALTTQAGGTLQWKVPKSHLEGEPPPQLPEYLYISPEKLLLLEG
jgi:molybdate transport system ATP-binding protein